MKNDNKIIKIVLIIFVVITVLLLGYIIFDKTPDKKQKECNVCSVKENEEVTKKTTTSTSREVVNIKSYKELEFKADKIEVGSGWAGATNHAIMLKDSNVYKIEYNGEYEYDIDLIATNVKDIGQINGQPIIYISEDTRFVNNKNYEEKVASDKRKYVYVFID